jgi:hypothetical protein
VCVCVCVVRLMWVTDDGGSTATKPKREKRPRKQLYTYILGESDARVVAYRMAVCNAQCAGQQHTLPISESFGGH